MVFNFISSPVFYLRPMVKEDIPKLNRLMIPLYYPNFWESDECLLSKINAFPQGCLVVEDTTKIIGYVFSHPWKSDILVELNNQIKIPERPDCYYIHDIAVDFNYRQMGIGKLLLGKVLIIAKECSLDKIKLVSVLNSYGFWSRLGFSDVEEVEYGDRQKGHVMVGRLENLCVN